MKGKRRANHHSENANSKFDEDHCAKKARHHAVRAVVQSLVKDKDEDQIGLTLLHFLKHPVVKPFLGQIQSMYNSESVLVGLHAAKGMGEIVRMVYKGKDSGGRSKECRALLSGFV